MFSIIAAIGKNQELGKNNQLIFHLKEDMQFFKETTDGHPVVMGHKTWKSLPKKLSNRTNIVVSHHEIVGADETISDLPAFITAHQNDEKEYFIIGGGSIYQAFLPFAKNLYLTEIDETAPDADTFFPEFNKDNYTRNILKQGSEDNQKYTIIKYIRKDI